MGRLYGAVLACALAATPVAAQDSAATPVQTPLDALAEDAADYARRHGVAADEALRRLLAQEETVAITDALADEFNGRVAGIAIEHVPTWRIVVRLTGDAPVADRVVGAGGLQVPILFRTGARATRDAVVAAITTHQAAIRAALARPPGLGFDARTGELVVTTDAAGLVLEGEEALRARLETMAGVPVRLRLLDREVDMLVDGGARVVGTAADGHRYACTTGFVVTDGVSDGVVTAAHCPDSLALAEPGRVTPTLDFVGQWGWGYQDVQVHRAPAKLQPLFHADTAKATARPVTAERRRAATRAGDTVCHRGERTGYSCAEVELIDFAPAGDLCGGACLPTWVTVAGPGCRGGDSGGPVFLGTTAFGILKGGSYRGAGGRCQFYYYMSTDYLPTGWSLLR